jgi:hypothetical protein
MKLLQENSFNEFLQVIGRLQFTEPLPSNDMRDTHRDKQTDGRNCVADSWDRFGLHATKLSSINFRDWPNISAYEMLGKSRKRSSKDVSLTDSVSKLYEQRITCHVSWGLLQAFRSLRRLKDPQTTQ